MNSDIKNNDGKDTREVISTLKHIVQQLEATIKKPNQKLTPLETKDLSSQLSRLIKQIEDEIKPHN